MKQDKKKRYKWGTSAKYTVVEHWAYPTHDDLADASNIFSVQFFAEFVYSLWDTAGMGYLN